MATFSEYTKKKKKQDIAGISFNDYTRSILGDSFIENDIAPVRTTVGSIDDEEEKKKEEAGKLDFFQKGAFDDGYQFGDITKTILGTVGDAGVGIVKGGASLVEGITDVTRYGVAGVADAFGKETYADKVRKKAQNNAVEDMFKSTDDYLNKYSVLGRTSDAVMQGLGQVGGIILTGGVAGALGAGALGATAVTTGVMGLSSAGSGMSEAYEAGATDKEATMYGISKGIIDAGSELIFGGLGKAVNAVGLSKGISSLDDVFAQKLSSKISNQVAKNFIEYGVKASAEGFEEVIAGLGSATAKKLTYMEEEELSKLVEDENLLEQFVVGTVTSGMIQSGYIPKTAEGSLKEANETGRDFITGYTQNEQAVIDKEVEKRVGDQKLSKKELGEIEEQVKKDLEKGYIDIDTIESTLGGETYSKYKSITEQEESLTKQLEELKNAPNTVGNAKLYEETENKLAELKKNSNKEQLKEQLSKEVQELTKSDLMLESYNEKGRRSQAFEADLTKYDEKQKSVIQKAVESGILNNTNRTHEFVDMVAKISADKGVSFDFTNNKRLKESGFAIEGKTINGYVKDGNIAINIDSDKAFDTIVGHEITHVLEGTDLYTELQNAVKQYATTKGEYQTRYDSLAELYKDVDGAVIENELTSDLVGEYLFTDSDFINSLSTEKPNVFKKIYDEIKYLYKLATAGSKEARELEKVKRAFDKAYKATNNAEQITSNVEYALNKIKDNKVADRLTPSEWNIVKSSVADHKKLNYNYQKTADGDIIIPVGNKLVYTDANFDSPGISKIIEIDSDYEYDVDYAREELYAVEKGESTIEEAYEIIRLFTKIENINEYQTENRANAGKYDRRTGRGKSQSDTYHNNFLQERIRSANEIINSVNNERAKASSKDGVFSNAKKDEDAKYSVSEENINKVTDDGLTMTYVRVPNKNTPYYGSTFGQNIEPAGEYMNMDEAKGKYKIDGYEYGTIQFKKPLVLEHINTSDTGWKKTVSDMYNGLTGKKLTKALIKDGYDAIVTYDEYGYSEIVNLNGKKLDDVRYSLSEQALEDRLSGDALLDAQDLIEEIENVAEISPNGYVTLYHRTTEDNAKKIRETGKMSAKEDGIFFSTKMDGDYSVDYGSGVVKLKVPVEKLVLDDIFSDEAHLRIPLKSRKEILDISNYLVNTDTSLSLGNQTAPIGRYFRKDIALETPETAPIAEAVTQPTEVAQDTFVDEYAPLTEEEANERDAMLSDRIDTLNDYDMPEEVEAPYYEEATEPTQAESPFEEKDIQEVGKRSQKAYMYENPEVKPFFQEEAQIMLGELKNSVKGQKHYNDQLYYDTNGEQGWYGTTRETSEQIAYMLDKFKYTYADIEKGLNAIIEDHGAENNAISKRLEFMIDERLREGYTDFASGYEIPSNQEYINLLNEKHITEYNDEAYNRYLESLAYAEKPGAMEAPVDEMQVLYSLEEQQQEKIAELDNAVETEDSIEATTLPTVESYDEKVENYKKALEGYKTARATIETSFDDAINKKTAEYNALKRKDTQKATTLLMQIETLKLRKNNNITTLDNKISKVETTIDKMSNGIPTKRQIYHRNIVDNIKSAFNSKGFDFDKVLEKAKNKGTFASVDNTPQRFIEKTLGYKEGQILNDLTVNKVAQNESKAIKWLNSFTDKKSGLLAQISKEYGIKPRSKESASAQMYGEGFWVDDDGNFIAYGDAELAKDFPNAKVRENIKKLAKDERVRKIYDDTLKMINDSRTRNLYPEIPRRKNYFLHFREMEDTFSKLGIPFNPNDIRLKDLPTDINGVTADLKPGQPYFASAKQRLGYKTTYDLIGGVERYLNSAKNQIYHIDDIQNLRALRNYIADTYGQAKGLESLDSMTEEEAVARIQEVYNSHLSTFAKFLNEEANVLAGKTSLTDRGLEGVIGRRGIQFLDTVNRQVGSNMVGGNISSALTNTVSMVQAIAKTNKFDATKAFAQTVSNQLGSIIGKTDGFVENNPMMIRRKGIERMTRTPWESITDKGYLLMGAIDNISSEFIARTKFNELTRKGMSEQQAHIEADKWASRLLGDRSLGQQPQLYNSKMLGLITKFQLEVRNQLDSQFYDTIQEAKVSNEEIENKLLRNMKTSAKIGSTFFQLAVLQHLFGKAFESVAGYNPAFDIVEALSQMLGFDDDEESEDTVLDNLEEGFLTLLGDLPYTSTFTGGRIPISSALPIKQFITGKDSYGNEKSRLETFTETAPYYFAPTGYGQFKKTKAGLEMFSEEHPVAGSYTKSGNLRFPIEDTPLNRLQAGIFGQYANENARDYFDNERAPLKEKQIQEYKDLDIPIRDYWEYREGLSKHDKLEDKADYINSLDLPVSKKNIMINNIADRKEAIDMTGYDDFSDFEEFDYASKNPEKYEFLQANNISYKEYSASKESKELYNWYYENPENLAMAKAVSNDLKTYKTYTKELSKLKADKDENGKTISGSRKEKVSNYINGLNADYGTKIVLFKKEYPSDDTYNNEIIEYLNSRNDISYEETVSILSELGFTVTADGTVIW